MAASEVSGGGWTAGKQLRRRELGAGVLFGREHSWVIAHDIGRAISGNAGCCSSESSSKSFVWAP